ncbi:hypothetical protein [Lysinibacillus fusiformis]|uniref:hypothetical protein n=1 Tax=Lysinibacillus fusiformis TaxID=28031 RepID=UPI003D002DD1
MAGVIAMVGDGDIHWANAVTGELVSIDPDDEDEPKPESVDPEMRAYARVLWGIDPDTVTDQP